VKLTILIPCFNEERTIATVLERVKKAPIGDVTKEIIVIDDGSTDKTRDILLSYQDDAVIQVVHHAVNEGKGKSIRTGLEIATGDIVLIQDADLEYDPNEYMKLLEPMLHTNAPVVYGSRYMTPLSKNLRPWGTGFITEVTNVLYGSKLTDEPTCYKLFTREVIKNITFETSGFAFCPEVTAKILRKHISIVEVPITYHRRTKSEGKKLSWFRDGFGALWTLIKYRIVD
jgi:dolichol-phosphate mannosyltransferase